MIFNSLLCEISYKKIDVDVLMRKNVQNTKCSENNTGDQDQIDPKLETGARIKTSFLINMYRIILKYNILIKPFFQYVFQILLIKYFKFF